MNTCSVISSLLLSTVLEEAHPFADVCVRMRCDVPVVVCDVLVVVCTSNVKRAVGCRMQRCRRKTQKASVHVGQWGIGQTQASDNLV